MQNLFKMWITFNINIIHCNHYKYFSFIHLNIKQVKINSLLIQYKLKYLEYRTLILFFLYDFFFFLRFL